MKRAVLHIRTGEHAGEEAALPAQLRLPPETSSKSILTCKRQEQSASLFVVANRDVDRFARGRECAVGCDCRVVGALWCGVNAEAECTLSLEH